jgi:hypothetical protein
MFGDDPRELALTPGAMEKEARERCNFNQTESRQRFREYLSHDRRFAEFDPDRLVERVMEARSNGRTLDLADPFLQRGGSKRPLSF